MHSYPYSRMDVYEQFPRSACSNLGGHGEKIDDSSPDGGSLDVVGDADECPDDSSAREHSTRDQQSGFGSASERSSLQEKTVNCTELEADGRGGDKVLASLRPVRLGVDCNQ